MNSPLLNLCSAPSNTDLIVHQILEENIPVLWQHGVLPGERIKIISKNAFQPILVEVRNVLIAMDRLYAKNIVVEKHFDLKNLE